MLNGKAFVRKTIDITGRSHELKMSISIGELIKLSLCQPKVAHIMRFDEPTMSRYMRAIDAVPALQKQIHSFSEFYDNYDVLVNVMAPNIEREERALLRQHKNLICSLVLEIFDSIT